MPDFEQLRRSMIEDQLSRRGLNEPKVLDAVMAIPRELFVPEGLVDSAYEDTPLPIAAGQTISQPYMVALMASALDLHPDDRVLEVGTGSGYSAAVLSRLAGRVYTVERHAELVESARATLAELGIGNVEVLHGDGSHGWPEHAPFDAIAVAAGSPEDIPQALLDQLAVGGRMVVPAGSEHLQKLWRILRAGPAEYQRENLGSVRFVPLIGRGAWSEGELELEPRPGSTRRATLPELIRRDCEPFHGIESADLSGLMDRIADARLVLIGEASHGTGEFYDMRARITERLVCDRGFNVVAVEADWPDAAAIDSQVREGAPSAPADAKPFSRFPTWMWANESVLAFVGWLAEHNRGLPRRRQVGFYGLDLYSMYASIASVLDYLDDVDPETARVARERYGCLMPWQRDPADYGRKALDRGFTVCERQVLAMLEELQHKRREYVSHDGARFFDASQNARLVTNAERYYRAMYHGARPSWNLRDQHMFDTLEAVLQYRGPDAKAVVWAHNSHLGDARATEMGAQGEHNVGQLVRQRYGDTSYLIGFGTDRGTVAAASRWGGPMEIKHVRPALPGSYERACHESGVARFLLPLRPESTRQALLEPRLERAIGVIYRPETERHSHYFEATLARQFDEYVYFDETHAVTPLDADRTGRAADTFPFGL